MAQQSTVYLIDSDAGARRELAFRLGALGIEAWPFSSAESFLMSVSGLRPKLVLLDLESASARGAEFFATLQRARIDWPIIALTRSHDIPAAIATMKLGFIDLLVKPTEESPLVNAIAEGFELLDRRLRASEIRDAAEARVTTLTNREFSICNGLLAGNPNKVVAYDLGISVRTVEAHRSHIMMKLGVRSIAEVCVLLAQAGVAPHLADTAKVPRALQRLFLPVSLPSQSQGGLPNGLRSDAA